MGRTPQEQYDILYAKALEFIRDCALLTIEQKAGTLEVSVNDIPTSPNEALGLGIHIMSNATLAIGRGDIKVREDK